MGNWTAYKQIVGYIDQLHLDIGQLTVLIERLMEEEDFESLPSAGNRSHWGLTSNYTRPNGWRIQYISRWYIPVDEDQYDQSIFYMIELSDQTVFDFPPMICGRMDHDLISERQIHDQVFLTREIMTLAHEKPSWKDFADENGFTVATPTFNTPATQVKGYILNLFDLSGRQQVIDNIIKPLTAVDEDINLDEPATIPTYRFADLKDDELTG